MDLSLGTKQGDEWFLLLTVPQPGLFPERAMAPHSSTLAWKIPWTQKPGGQSMGSLGVGHD